MPSVDRDLETICLKCLEKDPARRYSSAEALAEDLQRWQSGEPILARPSTTWERTIKWIKRRPTAAALVGVSVMAALALFIVGLVYDAQLHQAKTAVAAKEVEVDQTNEAARQANAEAEREREIARKASTLAAKRLGLANVAGGVRYMDGGDLNNALTLFTEALKEDHDDPVRQLWHRMRIGSTLRRFPRLVRLWQCDGSPNSAVFTKDGKTLVIAGNRADGQAGWWQAWDAATGTALQKPVPFEHPVSWLSLSPDGQKVLVAGGLSVNKRGSASAWDLAGGKGRPWTLKHKGGVYSAVFSPDGRGILTASSDRTARQWDAQSGQPRGPVLEHAADVRYAEYSPDGSRLVTACDDGRARIWDAASGKLLLDSMKHEEAVHFAVISPDGKRVATAGNDNFARVWDATTGKAVTPLLKHDNWVVHVAFSPSGTNVATTSFDGTAKVWNAGDGTLQATLKHSADIFVRQAIFSPDDRFVATCSDDGTARVWEASTGHAVTPELKHGGEVGSILFSPNGHTFASIAFDSTACLWDLAPGESTTPPLVHLDKINAAWFSPDSSLIATASDDRTVRIWNAATGQPICPPLVHDAPVTWETFSRDGRRLATATRPNSASRIWDIATGKLLETVDKRKDEEWVNGYPTPHLAVFASGPRVFVVEQWVANLEAVSYRLWRSQSVTSFLEGKVGHRLGPVYELGKESKRSILSPDGRRLMSLSDEQVLRVWDIGPDDRPTEDLVLLAQVLTDQRIDSVGNFTTTSLAERRAALGKTPWQISGYVWTTLAPAGSCLASQRGPQKRVPG